MWRVFKGTSQRLVVKNPTTLGCWLPKRAGAVECCVSRAIKPCGKLGISRVTKRQEIESERGGQKRKQSVEFRKRVPKCQRVVRRIRQGSDE